MKLISKGTDDFKEIRDGDYLFIDKTLLIKEIIDNGDKVLLFPRPRRFGKSLNLSMLRYYFDITLDSKNLFKGLNIMKEDKKYIKEMNSYPVISLTLKGLKKDTYEEFISSFKNYIALIYNDYKYLLSSNKVSDLYINYFKNILDEKEEKLTLSLSYLMSMLNEYYGKQVIVLMDEYDAPIMNAYQKGYYDKIIGFMRDLFESTFKGNINLKKGIITGILRVSKEGMFSGANNISVYNITDSDFSSYFGFTEEEVIDTLKEYNLDSTYKDVKKWYDGYLFGKTTIFAPWSILEYLSDSEHVLKNRWTKTGSIELIKELVYENNADMFEKFNQLLEEKKIEGVDLNLNMNLTDLESDANTIWTLLMLTGYLTPASFCPSEKNVTLRIPNHEICENLKDMRNSFFKNAFSNTNNVIKDIREERLELLEEDYQKIVIDAFSYYDTDRKEGERFYHGFTLGILYQLGNDYIVKSNRESGYGRSDIIVTKKDKSVGYIFELKEARRKEDLIKETREGLKQIEEKKYSVELKDYKKIYKIAIAFSGKEVKLKYK